MKSLKSIFLKSKTPAPPTFAGPSQTPARPVVIDALATAALRASTPAPEPRATTQAALAVPAASPNRAPFAAKPEPTTFPQSPAKACHGDDPTESDHDDDASETYEQGYDEGEAIGLSGDEYDFESDVDSDAESRHRPESEPTPMAEPAVANISLNAGGSLPAAAAKRLMKDLGKWDNADTRTRGFEIALVDDNDLSRWEAKIWFEPGSKMHDDLKANAKKTGENFVTLRLHFPPTYPFEPPVAVVIRPRFEQRTGHITVEGGVCNPMLTLTHDAAGWSSAYGIETVLVAIQANMIAGDGRLSKKQGSYSEVEAIQGFARVARDHGWRIGPLPTVRPDPVRIEPARAPTPVPPSKPLAAPRPTGTSLAKLLPALVDMMKIDDVNRSLQITLPTSQLSRDQRQALGLGSTAPLLLTVTMDVTGAKTKPSEFILSQGDPKDAPAPLVTRSKQPQTEFKVGYQLRNIVQAYFDKRWSRPKDASDSTEKLLELSELLAGRIENLGDFCVCCDAPQAIGGLRPTVCDNSLCAHQYDDLGLGAGLGEVRTNRDATDLLVSMAAAAASSMRAGRRNVFEQFPDSFRQTNGTGDFNGIAAAIAAIPNLDKLAEFAAEEKLHESNPQAYKVLRWIISSNRGYLRPLEESERMPDLGSVQQFALSMSSPQHEIEFAKLKAKYGSTLAFHGSAFENWHNILRTSIKNASGTSLQSSGAVHGAGIYLGLDSRISAGYSGRGSGNVWKGSRFSGSVTCMAVCEVIKHPKNHSHSNILVVPEEACVTTRYLLVAEGASSLPSIQAKALRPR